MTLATLDSIKQKGKIDYKDIMDEFTEWLSICGLYTIPRGAFDIESQLPEQSFNTEKEQTLLTVEVKTEWDNGNGSLMRILPVCLYLYNRQKMICTSENESIYLIHNVSALIHAHLRSQIACGIYYFMVKSVLSRVGDLLAKLPVGN